MERLIVAETELAETSIVDRLAVQQVAGVQLVRHTDDDRQAGAVEIAGEAENRYRSVEEHKQNTLKRLLRKFEHVRKLRQAMRHLSLNLIGRDAP